MIAIKLIIPIGIPASGKTFWRKKYINKYPKTVIISPDDIRQSLYNYKEEGFNPKYEKRVWIIAYAKLEYNLKLKNDCFFDATNIWSKDRAPMIMIGKSYNAEIIGVYFKIHPKLAVLRNKQRGRMVPESVIYHKYYTQNPPSLEEGFSRIKIIMRYITELECKQIGGIVKENKCIICDEISIISRNDR